jgi:hypothetical protein
MEEALVLVEEYQSWIYLVLGVFGLVYLRLTINRAKELRSTFFGLERARARENLIRSIMMLSLVGVGLVVTFIAATFGGPAIPIAARPTVLPTVSLLSTPEEPTGEEGVIETATAMGEGLQDESGCFNQNATILSPENEDSVSGVVEIVGIANIPGFAFYKIEVMSLTPDSVWQAIGAGTDPVCENCDDGSLILARWDTSLITPGEYILRLVVTDSAGNAPLPCEIDLRVLPTDEE